MYEPCSRFSGVGQSRVDFDQGALDLIALAQANGHRADRSCHPAELAPHAFGYGYDCAEVAFADALDELLQGMERPGNAACKDGCDENGEGERNR